MMRTLMVTLLVLAALPALAQPADPTRPPTPAEIQAWLGEASGDAADSDLRLQSVLVSDSRRVAVINGQRLGPGDTIGDARVKAIEYGHVVVEREGRTINLRLANRLGIDSRKDKL